MIVWVYSEEFSKMELFVNLMDTPVTITTALSTRKATVAKITLWMLLNFPTITVESPFLFIGGSPLRILSVCILSSF